MTAELTAPRLINMKQFAFRLGDVSVRTVERMYQAKVPGLPPIVRISSIKMVDENLAARFIAMILKKGGLPGRVFTPHGAAAETSSRASKKSSRATVRA